MVQIGGMIMRQLPKGAAPAEILAHKRKWADKTRLGRMPYKRCHDCGLEKPNTEQFFPLAGPRRNHIGVFCRDCVIRMEQEKIPQPCPICAQVAVLKVVDKHRTRMCTRCMKLSNIVIENVQIVVKILMYLDWRTKKEAG